jgi:hypothetical protein
MDMVRNGCRLGLESDRRIVTVTSIHNHEDAKTIGEEFSDVVVVCNPEHPLDPNDIRRGTVVKFTVTRRNAEIAVDLLGAYAELRRTELWIGDEDYIESSPLSSSRLTLDKVVDIVRRHLKEV